MPKYYPGKYTNDLRNHFASYMNSKINKELLDIPEEYLSLFKETMTALKKVVKINKKKNE